MHLLNILVWAYVSVLLAQTPTDPAASPGGVRDFRPGVRIDWGKRAVEVEATVVLREGLLELLACSPNTREHESILTIKARPRDIYQAMGLIGLEPGKPVRFDEADKKPLPPTGEKLHLSVRYRKNDNDVVVAVEDWLLDTGTGKRPDSLKWVFAGARTLEDGRFAADDEGTIVCVVDFDTALIAVGSVHSADNDQLWLGANTAEIPPIGTRCTLLIKKAEYKRPAVIPPP